MAQYRQAFRCCAAVIFPCSISHWSRLSTCRQAMRSRSFSSSVMRFSPSIYSLNDTKTGTPFRQKTAPGGGSPCCFCHSDFLFWRACIRHCFPRRLGGCLNGGWLHRLMGLSPPRGSPAAALIACSPIPGGLGLGGSIIVAGRVVAKQSALDCFPAWMGIAPALSGDPGASAVPLAPFGSPAG